MRVFVAGSTGVVGRRLVPLLLEQGHAVTALTRKPSSATDLAAQGATVVGGDVMEAAQIRDVLGAARPDVVMHQLTDLSARDLRANAALRVAGTRNLVDAALAVGVTRVVAQSIAWAYAPGAGPAAEGEPLDVHASGTRGESVAAVHALERTTAQAPDWVALRYGMLYGTGTWFAPEGLRAGEARTCQLTADGSVTSFLHVDDAAAAAVQALDWPSGPVNVVDDEPAPGHAWVPVFCAAVGAPMPPMAQEAEPWARGASNGRARSFGFVPRLPSWREGFNRL
jgi:nucleoside-diphosphate-sugar epimerase